MARAKESAAEFLRLERALPAPRSLVYRALTEPARMMQWFGPHGFDPTNIEVDLREGGSWRGGMRGPDGQELVASGVYRDVVTDELLVFTHAWETDGARGHETVCRVELLERGDRTLLIFTQGPFESAASAKSHESGWGEALERLVLEVAQ